MSVQVNYTVRRYSVSETLKRVRCDFTEGSTLCIYESVGFFFYPTLSYNMWCGVSVCNGIKNVTSAVEVPLSSMVTLTCNTADGFNSATHSVGVKA